MSKPKVKKIEQNLTELQDMVGFYSQQYQEVYFVRDLLADCIIAVECYPANSSYPVIERGLGIKRNIFGYQNLFYTTRRRLDVNQNGERMIGYESASGNDTRLATVECGEIPTVNGKDVLNGASASTSISPFERAQIESTVRIKQASSKKSADYETYTDKDGHFVERFETFEIVRMK